RGRKRSDGEGGRKVSSDRDGIKDRGLTRVRETEGSTTLREKFLTTRRPDDADHGSFGVQTTRQMTSLIGALIHDGDFLPPVGVPFTR
ncbi:hypothetical protein HN51_036688, partial [Arachis hypogaea]